MIHQGEHAGRTVKGPRPSLQPPPLDKLAKEMGAGVERCSTSYDGENK